MSLRPEISGFDLAKMRAFIGCGDPGVADRAAAYAREVYAHQDPSDQEVIVTWLRRIVLGEVAPGSLKAEDGDLIEAVITLAWFEQKHHGTGSNRWGSEFIHFALEAPKRLPDIDATARQDVKALLGSALLQRPIFGSEQDSEWTFYGYLSNDEVGRLLRHQEALSRLGEGTDPFAVAFFGWLREIHGAKLDYWFYCQ